ncbi:MAG TPA: ATP-grasp domain-containing protein [Actinoplanes sp.]|nr:ATP-grasp domain-containing protein [Actinoplanes sp.]
MTSSSLISRRIGRTLTRDAQRRLQLGGSSWRRRFVLAELTVAAAVCLAAVQLLGESTRRVELRLTAAAVRLLGLDRIRIVDGDTVVVTAPDGGSATVATTGSTSALPGVLALVALAVVALRYRPRAPVAVLAAGTFVLLANQLSVLLSLVAGRYLPGAVPVLLGGWLGALLNTAYTLIGLLIMTRLAMPETSAAGRPRRWLHRLLPASVAARLTARRDRRQVDDTVEHETAVRRAVAVRELAEQGLDAHIATLLAVAAHETQPQVLDALAGAVAAQQWEPAANRDVIALRLWARAWLMRAPVQAELPEAGRLVAVTGAGEPAGVAVIRALQAGGEHVLALDTNPDAVGLRLAGRSAVLPPADQPGYADALLAVLDEHRPAALICTVCEEYAVLTPLAGRLAELGTKAWLPDPVAVEVCLDKARFAAALQAAGVDHAATAQTRPGGREFTADALVARDGTLLTCVPRWRDETRGGSSVRGTTFDSTAVTLAVAAALRAVGLTGPASVRGFVTDAARLDDPDAAVTVTVVEVNPRFSGGLPLTLAAGADVVGTYLAGILDPDADLPRLTYRPQVRMARHFAEVYYAGDGSALPDPLALSAAR